MRVLVTGASGLLGTWLLREAPRATGVIAGVHTGQVAWPHIVRADLRDGNATSDAIGSVAPDVVVHAAYLRDRASIVDASTNVARAAADLGARLVLVSTDAVFTGDGRPRSEHDVPDPVWDYGRWKVEAEQAVVSCDPRAAIVRLPLLVSLDPPDQTVARVRAAAIRHEPLGWHDGERRQPASAAEVAGAIWQLLQLNPSRSAGVWHLPGPERLLRRELGARVASALGLNDPAVTVPAPSPDERPHDLHLANRRARRELAWNPRPVLAGAAEL
jgi:dTDP-4-dehydrorhamnose reductase